MKRTLALILCALLLLAFAGCAAGPSESVPEKPHTDTQTPETSDKTGETTIGETETPEHPPKKTDYNVSAGSETYRGFLMDNILHSDVGDIHFHLYIPESYDKSEPYALYLSLPGYEGLYFQGVGTNIRSEDFVFEAQKYNNKMIIAAPQLSDWGNSSAEQTIALTEYLLDAYAIDRGKVYINGYSGGGETLSLVLTKRPELLPRRFMSRRSGTESLRRLCRRELRSISSSGNPMNITARQGSAAPTRNFAASTAPRG